MQTEIMFLSAGTFISEGPIVYADLVLTIRQDGQDLGQFMSQVKIPSGGETLHDVEVSMPKPNGDGPHGVPRLQHPPYRLVVVSYLVRILGRVATMPPGPEPFRFEWVVAFDSEKTHDDGGW